MDMREAGESCDEEAGSTPDQIAVPVTLTNHRCDSEGR